MTPTENIISAYHSSRDYKRLAELARQSSVVCIVDYCVGGGEPIRDIARTQYSRRGDEETFMVAARGTGYITAFGEDEFLKFCANSNLEFLEPATAVGEARRERVAPAQVTDEMLAAAMKKAVELKLVPARSDAESYLKTWDAMKATLQSVLDLINA